MVFFDTSRRFRKDLFFSARQAGVLTHFTSLPSEFGIGNIGEASRRFLDWLLEAGFSVWQFLPFSPSAAGNSPYSPYSTFAGNPLLLCPVWLHARGLLTDAELASLRRPHGKAVNFSDCISAREAALRKAYRRWKKCSGSIAARSFFSQEEFAGWIRHYLEFMLLQRQFCQPWYTWRDPERRGPGTTGGEDVFGSFDSFLQWAFWSQWQELREYAHSRSIALFGDIPFYVGDSSAEVWANRHLFVCDENGIPCEQAAVPPDLFSANGQLWGNPVYNWDAHVADGFAWWHQRVRWHLEVLDVIRIDHFRAFAGYASAPIGATKVDSCWKPSPGTQWYDSLVNTLGSDLPLVAEDLGVITPDVFDLLERCGFPGIRVPQFAWAGPDPNERLHRLHNIQKNSVVYTGTHDNHTVAGFWRNGATPKQRFIFEELMGAAVDESTVCRHFGRLVLTTPAFLAMIHVQDLYGDFSRDNLPGVPGDVGGYWSYRIPQGKLTRSLAMEWRTLLDITDRLPKEEVFS